MHILLLWQEKQIYSAVQTNMNLENETLAFTYLETL